MFSQGSNEDGPIHTGCSNKTTKAGQFTKQKFLRAPQLQGPNQGACREGVWRWMFSASKRRFVAQSSRREKYKGKVVDQAISVHVDGFHKDARLHGVCVCVHARTHMRVCEGMWRRE